jgi:hypothetical protein
MLTGPGAAYGTTQTAVSTGTTSVAAGQSVTYSATVTPTSGIGTPTGTVTFASGPTPLCVATLVSATASCSSDNAPVGDDTVTGVYAGDENFVGSSGTGTLAVGLTTTVTAASPSVALPGQEVSFSATVAAVIGTGSPSGTVAFTDGSTALCVATLEAGTGSCLSSGSPSGNLTVVGTYSGDSDFAPSAGTTHLDVGPATVTAVSVSAPSSPAGQQVTYSATVTPAVGTGTPTGTVDFAVGGTSLCVATLVGGTGSCSSTAAPGGTDTVTGTYSGDSTYTGSSGSASLFVDDTPTSTEVSAEPHSVSSGQLVTFSATVDGIGMPTGSVAITSGTKALCVVTLVTGTGSCTADGAPVGVDTVTGTYSGDPNFSVSSGTTFLDVGGTVTSVSIHPASATAKAMTYSATVAPVVGTGAPTGKVDFSVGGKQLCVAALVDGTGSCSSSGAPLGTDTVSGVYSGDPNFSRSSGEAVVAVGATTTNVSVNQPSVAAGQQVRYSATVIPVFGSRSLTGTVTFSVGTTTICVATLARGSGSCTSESAPLGTDTVTGRYSGSANFTGSAGATSLDVGVTTTTVSTDPATVGVGGPETYTFSATVTPAVGRGLPTGTVTFSDGGTTLCVATLVGGDGSCSAETAPGAFTVVAAYSGDPNYAVSDGSDTLEYWTAVPASCTQIFGQNVQCEALINTEDPYSSGTVTFAIGSLVLCRVDVGDFNVGDGIYCYANDVPLGTSTVTATYSGDANNVGSSSSFTLSLGQVTVTSVSASPTPVAQGQLVTYSATVTAPAGGSPSGSVSFSAGESPLCTAPIVGGSASCSSPNAPVGVDAATATYSGDTHFAGSLGWTTVPVVALPTTSTSAAVTPSSSELGQSVAYSATVGGPSGAGTPTGTVTFSVGSVQICSGALTQGSTSCSSSHAPAGVDTVIASYSGDSSFASSQADTTLTVMAPPTIAHFTPSSGKIGHVVTIRGMSLSGATEVQLGDTTGTIESDTATRIKFLVPPGATSGKIEVTTPGGTAMSTKSFDVS